MHNIPSQNIRWEYFRKIDVTQKFIAILKIKIQKICYFKFSFIFTNAKGNHIAAENYCSHFMSRLFSTHVAPGKTLKIKKCSITSATGYKTSVKYITLSVRFRN